MMRSKRSKKRKSSLTFTNTKLLHSNTGKSTYFYSKWFSSYGIPLASAASLLLVLGLTINPLMTNHEEARAADNVATLALGPGTIGLTMTGSTDLTRNLTSGMTGYVSSTFKVEAGTDLSQYQVMVQAANGYSSSLVGAVSKETVGGITGSVKGNALENNTWGYALQKDATYTSETDLANMTYRALPGSGATTAAETVALNKAAAVHDYTLAFAANIKDKTADHYQTNVLLSVVAGAGEVSSFYNLTYMQDMTSTICRLASENDTTILEDKRDHKKYWIAKLKDGNCWMTQNLDLDIPASGLTAALSDMETDWNSSSAYPPVATKTTIEGWVSTNDTVGYNTVQSYDPGNYYHTTPNAKKSCNSSQGLIGCTSSGWRLNVTNNAAITGLVDVFDWTLTTDPYFITRTTYMGTDGTSTCTKATGSLFGDGTYSQCRIYYNTGGDYSKAYEHYHAGNYYSWIAATAGAGNASIATAGANVLNSSICPRNWKLPTTEEAYNSLGPVAFSDIVSFPYYYVPEGAVANGSMYRAGEYGYYWSSTLNNSNGTQVFASFFASSWSRAATDRYYGVPVRCVAR